ncbi:MAG: hypothetical protein PQJ61_07785 [Spirochaetales bacterium]|uniref:Uncharacterized protein n=1 Tax=Candidatus Thalassospirochaeta sargassi TaxID=3119039 RepID=A0AAJ1IFZ9_9SPIO|nr:hypothetical protein [Spirochaetales bacterium]
MKNRRIITLILISLIITVSLTGCLDLLGNTTPEILTIQQRLDAFADDLNADTRSAADILENIGSDEEMENDDNANDPAYWDYLSATYTWEFTVTDDSDTDAVVVQVTKTTSDGDIVDEPVFTFGMYQESSGDSSGNWLIKNIYDNDEGNYCVYRRIDL